MISNLITRIKGYSIYNDMIIRESKSCIKVFWPDLLCINALSCNLNKYKGEYPLDGKVINMKTREVYKVVFKELNNALDKHFSVKKRLSKRSYSIFLFHKNLLIF